MLRGMTLGGEGAQCSMTNRVFRRVGTLAISKVVVYKHELDGLGVPVTQDHRQHQSHLRDTDEEKQSEIECA